MALTRDFKETVGARAAQDRAFRRALLQEAIDSMLEGDVATGKAILRDFINAGAQRPLSPRAGRGSG